MAVYYVVFGQKPSNVHRDAPPEPKFTASAKVLDAPQLASFARVEAGSVKEAQQLVTHFYSGRETTTPVIVAESAWKTS